jgi:hypothetical protein
MQNACFDGRCPSVVRRAFAALEDFTDDNWRSPATIGWFFKTCAILSDAMGRPVCITKLVYGIARSRISPGVFLVMKKVV